MIDQVTDQGDIPVTPNLHICAATIPGVKHKHLATNRDSGRCTGCVNLESSIEIRAQPRNHRRAE